MRKLLLIVSFLAYSLLTSATHIVGGEFQLQHVRGYNYDLSLILYFDVNNGNPLAEDNSINVSIFQKVDNKLVRSILLNKKAESGLQYQYPNCTIDELKTKKIRYGTDSPIYLDTILHNSPQGYYFSWERCCRNNIISNIVNPQSSGMTFYMEFPPIQKDGLRFTNSSPIMPEAFAEYGCINQLFSYSFKSTDKDNDKLVYSLVAPLEGNSTEMNPVPGPISGPYDPVTWRTGYSLANIMNGSPRLTINSQTGLMTVKPSQAGLFVFAVKIEEFRAGVKIGEVRREYQLLVVDCIENRKPSISLFIPDNNGNQVLYNSLKDTIDIMNSENVCYNLNLTDQDSNENLKIKLLPLNFNESYVSIDKSEGLIKNPNDILNVSLCWTKCIDIQLPYYKLAIVAEDDGCSKPMSDTLYIVFRYIGKLNTKPKLYIEPISDIRFDEDSVILANTNEDLHFNIVAYDADSTDLTVEGKGINFNFKDNGVQFQSVTGNTLIKAPFLWKINCEFKSNSIYRALFWVKDKLCTGLDSIPIEIKIKISERIDSIVEFRPANVFTPNGDGVNDYFETNDIPLDVCNDRFEEIAIYNRWGNLVFKEKSRKFRWDGANVPDGVYFYIMKYSKSKYKGYVSIIR
jgi:gliding motility-associated-like protein